MTGAQMIYTRMQSAWDKRDLEDIRKFTSPEVYAEIQRQAQADPRPGRDRDPARECQAARSPLRQPGDCLGALRCHDARRGCGQLAKQVREVWHFSRDEKAAGSFWRLEGIQQVEG